MKKQSGDVMKQRLLRAVNQLTHREKVILFAYINDKHEINNGGKLPKIIMGYLCEKFKINKDEYTLKDA